MFEANICTTKPHSERHGGMRSLSLLAVEKATLLALNFEAASLAGASLPSPSLLSGAALLILTYSYSWRRRSAEEEHVFHTTRQPRAPAALGAAVGPAGATDDCPPM